MTRLFYRGFLICAVLFFSLASTGAYFTDSVSVSGNSFSTGTWVTPPGPSPSVGVVINELMWMGSVGHTADEWIELRNMTSAPIDLSGWKLSKNTGSETLMLTLPAGANIPADGYYLISNYSSTNVSSALNATPDYVTTSVDLSNSALQIKLYNGAIDPANLIDTAGNGGVPLAGNNGANKESMSRNSTPGDGTQAASWYTDTISNGTIYWDSADGNYGTPGGPNA